MSIRLEQAGAAANGMAPPGAFCLQMSNLQTSVALEGSNKDVR